MNVKELIAKLEEIEDKTLPVCIEDWNEGYAHDMEFDEITIDTGRFATKESVHDSAKHVVLGVSS